jgi:hypothetical protein
VFREHGGTATQTWYITEKLFVAFQAGGIPVYWGSRDVLEVFNADAFILWDPSAPEIALGQLAYLEANRTAYHEMRARPYLADGAHTVERFMSYRADVGGGKMRQKVLGMLGT